MARTQSLPNVNLVTPANSGAENIAAVSGSNRTEDREELLLQACLKLVDEITSAAGKHKNVSIIIKNSLLKIRAHLKELGKLNMDWQKPEGKIYPKRSTKRVRTEDSTDAASLAPKKKKK